MFGAYLAQTEESFEKVEGLVRDVYAHFLTDRKRAYIPLNLNAMERGFAHVRSGAKGPTQRFVAPTART